MRVSRSIVAGLIALTLGACGLFEDANRLGVSAEGEGDVRAHFVPCPGQAVTRVALLSQVGSGVHLETGDDQPGDDPEDDEVVIWSVGAAAGSPETTFQMGVTPPGFTDEIPLVGRPADHSGIAAFVGYRSADGGLASLQIGFDIDDLESDRILTLSDFKDPATFQSDGRALCE